MLVKNLNGTSDNTCKCGTWINHWIKFSKSIATVCVVKGCTHKASMGGHVQKEGLAASNHWHIIPICQNCNNKRGQTLVVDENTILVSANKNETCNKY